jgi:hypothetical protein
MTCAPSRSTVAAVVAAVVAFTLASGCSAPDQGKVPMTLPDRASFTLVGELLVVSCGTLDCHGSVGRNFKLYGHDGLRLSASDLPGKLPLTTARELDADYGSLVALEPELISAVVKDNGARPERLTLVRKARNAEKHEGQQIFVPGSDDDRCLTSWLANAVDVKLCSDAIAVRTIPP